MEGLKEKTARGLFWGSMNSGIQQLLGLVFGIILGRLLSQSDYGMVAMITIFTVVVGALQDSGFRTALINLPDPKDEDYNSVFWFNIVISLLLYAILFFSAPLIARYYHTPELVWLCRYAFLSFVFASFSIAQIAYLYRELRVKQIAKASIAATIMSNIVGVTMAFCGMGYWSLATQSIVFVGLNTLLLWHYSPWRPSIHGITFEPVRRMFRFSVKLLASTIMSYVNNNVLNILLGRYFSPHAVGTYNQAYQWNSKCNYVVQGMIGQVSLPVLSNLHDDKGRQLRALRKMMRFTAFLSFPLLFGFGLVAKEFIVLAITDKWIESAMLIQILCIAGAVTPIASLLSNSVISEGRSGVFFWCTCSLGMALIALMIAIAPYGIRQMVVGYTCLNVVWVFVWFFFVSRMTAYSLWQFLADTLPFALSAAGTMVFTYLITSSFTSLWLLLISRIVIAATLYYIIMRVAKAKILEECIDFIFKKRGRDHATT